MIEDCFYVILDFRLLIKCFFYRRVMKLVVMRRRLLFVRVLVLFFLGIVEGMVLGILVVEGFLGMMVGRVMMVLVGFLVGVW